jgi:anti-anti-sigma factor
MLPQIKWSRRKGILIAIPIGRIDGSNHIAFQNNLEFGIEPEEKALILDCAQLGFISSAGLRICLIVGKQFNQPGKAFGICNLSDSIQDIVTVSGFDKILSIYKTRSEAIEAITGQTSAGSDQEETETTSTIPMKSAVNFDVIGENIGDIANFTIEKYEYEHDRTLSLAEREAVVAAITNSLWQFVEGLKTRRKQILEQMFRTAEEALDEVVARTN